MSSAKERKEHERACGGEEGEKGWCLTCDKARFMHDNEICQGVDLIERMVAHHLIHVGNVPPMALEQSQNLGH